MTPPLSERALLLRRALALFDLHGADAGRWPAAAQGLARDFAGDPAFEAARAEALRLAETLAEAPAPAAGEALKARILESAPAPAARAAVFEVRGFFRPRRFAPAGMLAGLSALGFAAGVASAAPGGGDEALAYAEAAVVAALEEEDAFWADVE